MSVVRFSDGERFDTSGPRRIVRRSDGLYVIGGGMLIPIESVQEGREIIAEHTGDELPAKSAARRRQPGSGG